MIAPDALATTVAFAWRIALAPSESKLGPPTTINGKPAFAASASSMAVAASVDQTIALARGLAALDRIAQAAADHLVAQDAALEWTTRVISPADLLEVEVADAAVTAARIALAEALDALGYIALKEPEKTDGSAS